VQLLSTSPASTIMPWPLRPSARGDEELDGISADHGFAKGPALTQRRRLAVFYTAQTGECRVMSIVPDRWGGSDLRRGWHSGIRPVALRPSAAIGKITGLSDERDFPSTSREEPLVHRCVATATLTKACLLATQ
jgi:hypothetical protein